MTFAIAVSVGIALAGAQPRLPGTLRVATFNIFELSCAKIDAVDSGGKDSPHSQLLKAAEILRRVQPDVLLINEIDYSADANCARRFADRYLANQRDGLASLDLPHLVYLPVNTGVPSGFDFTNDGDRTDPEDAFGFGAYPGQYGMALFSRYPPDAKAIPHVPAVPLEGHARAPHARWASGTASLLFRRGCTNLPPVEQEPTGTCRCGCRAVSFTF